MAEETYALQNWNLESVAWFRRTKDPLGDFSNFASGMPIQVRGFIAPSSEHLYQAMRFTGAPEIQVQILSADSPKASKAIARDYDHQTRDDWHEIRVEVMRWVLARKISAHFNRIDKAFRQSGNSPIVEYSKRDAFWGAQPLEQNEAVVSGQNVLGCLLTELREAARRDRRLKMESKPNFPQALLLGSPV